MKTPIKNKAWDVLGTLEVYKDPWIRLRVDKVVLPNGSVGNYSVIELKGGIGVVVIDEEEKITLVGQYRYAIHSYSWEIPKGAFDSSEERSEPLTAAKRELKEETGIMAKNWSKLSVVHTLIGSTDDTVFLFVASDLSIGKTNHEATEKIATKKVTFSEFFKMVYKGEITDATSIAAVSLAKQKLKIK